MPGRTALDQEMTKPLIEVKGKVSAKIVDSRKLSIILCADLWTKKGMTEAFVGHYSTLFHPIRS